MSDTSTARTPLSRIDGAPPNPRASRATAQKVSLPVDLWLIVGVLGVMVVSLVMLKAVTADDVAGSPNYFVYRQAVFFAIGTVAAVFAARFEYPLLRHAPWRLWGLLIAMIVAVFLFGGVTRGSVRAIQTPFFDLQLSELGKVMLSVILAGVVVERAREMQAWSTTARIAVAGLIPAGLVLLEDLGSGLVFLAITAMILYVGGTPGRHLAALAAAAVSFVLLVTVAMPAAGITVLKPYQVDRLTCFVHPSSDPGSACYQLNQSVIATGSGGKTGRGDASTQTKNKFLPEHHTDFAFAALSERWGFTGAGLLLSLYALIIWRALRILSVARDLFGALIVAGIVAMLLFEVVENVGMNVGIMPITGIPLPLLSYGGSSVISTLLAIGLLQSIHARGRASAQSKGRITSGL